MHSTCSVRNAETAKQQLKHTATNMNKIVALLTFKNEIKYLQTYLATVKPIVDEIIAIDDGSTDEGPELLRQAGCTVIRSDEKVKAGWAELGIRNRLLELGRASGGTHFVCLDADETFTSQFIKIAPTVFSKMMPGQKIRMQWLAMWKTVDHYRDDQSVWSRNYKDFIFCDDGKMSYPDVWMHTPRTPGVSDDSKDLVLNPKHGAVMHFQFTEFGNFQIKQAFYRMSELVKLGPENWMSINQKYSITLEDPNVKVRCIEDSWYVNPMPKIGSNLDEWRLEVIKDYFDEYGCVFFENLQIWHIPELKEEFIWRTGRNPNGV